MRNVQRRAAAISVSLFALACGLERGAQGAISVLGTDAIYVAGRTNFVAGTATDPLPANNPPDDATVPKSLATFGGLSFSFTVTGNVGYSSTDTYPADGALPFAGINGLNGISAYNGPKGALVGVFLDNTPTQNTATPPTALDSTNTTFSTISPGLGQVFFIGDGLTGTGTGTAQHFITPAGATQLFLGIADGHNYAGAPGYYDDNSGSFSVDGDCAGADVCSVDCADWAADGATAQAVDYPYFMTAALSIAASDFPVIHWRTTLAIRGGNRGGAEYSFAAALGVLGSEAVSPVDTPLLALHEGISLVCERNLNRDVLTPLQSCTQRRCGFPPRIASVFAQFGNLRLQQVVHIRADF